ncbi:hypothetical protein STFR1_50030 [Bacillus vallismortis]
MNAYTREFYLSVGLAVIEIIVYQKGYKQELYTLFDRSVMYIFFLGFLKN